MQSVIYCVGIPSDSHHITQEIPNIWGLNGVEFINLDSAEPGYQSIYNLQNPSATTTNRPYYRL